MAGLAVSTPAAWPSCWPERVLLHPLAGVLSAYGLGMAEQSLLLECSPRLPLRPDSLPLLRQRCAELEQRGSPTCAGWGIWRGGNWPDWGAAGDAGRRQ